jgi:hypothetical protein
MPLVQIGIKALRAPNGDFLPSVPIYAEIAKTDITPSGITKTENDTIDELSRVLAKKFKQYVDECRAAEREERKKA